MEAVSDSDMVVLVTEPTPFGLHDLKLAVEMTREMSLRPVVVINRSDVGNDQTKNYCEMQRIEIIAEIPESRDVATCYSRGLLPVNELDWYKDTLRPIVDRILREAR